MKTNKLMLAAMLLGALAMVSCKKTGNDPEKPDKKDTTSVVVPDLEEEPVIVAPGAGKVIVAVRVPQGTCNGMIAVGAATNEDGTDDWAPADKKKPFVAVEGTETWYQITLPANPGIGVKVIALAEDGTADWGTQWGMNVEGEEPNVTIVNGEGTIDASENGGEVKLTELKENTVVFVDVKAWKTSPCTPKNEAGIASFTLTANNLPEGYEVGIVGKVNNLEWDITAPVVMTKGEGNVYTATDVPVAAACQYKYFVRLIDGGEWSWDYGMDGGNLVMPLDLKAVDTVDAWKLPAAK